MDNPRIVIQLNHSLVIKKVTASDDGHYQCFNEFVNPNGGGGRIIRLRVKEKLKFIDPQKDKKLELNSVSKLHCKTRGHLPQTVTWIKNGFKFLPDHIKQERGTLMFNGVLSTDAGRYTCIASDSLTTINSTVSVEVVKSPKFTKKPAKYVESEVGSFVELHCAAEGDPAPIIHWEKNKEFNDFKADHRITTYPNGSLLISNFQQKDEGKYGCIAGNSAGLERAEVNLAIGTSSSSVRSANGYSATSTELEGDDKMTKTILITGGVVTLYMVFVLILMIWCRYRTAKRKAASMLNHNGNKPENGDLEMKERKSLTSQ
ncbi:tyrosine-protein kinase-like otk [Panonychus citri]|uniref:tyrosine-protein kinase-like otk n=1 Tax=Panonychus citri TaxID=50023 RepID=UPI002306DDEE|nr:tyrosine-protein kinase-like otk [Panonychus citri]